MTTNNYRPLFGPRSIAIASVCAVLAVLAAHHPFAAAQSVESAVSPVVPQDAAEAANRRLKLDPAATATALRIVLPPPDALESQESEAESRGNRPLQIGFPRSKPSQFRGDLSPRIDWIPLDDGSIAGTVLVTSPGARAMRAGIRAELGPEGEIRFFAPNVAEGHSKQGRESRELPVITQEDFYEGGEPEILWSPTVEGDTLGVEITLPSREALSAFSFRIEQVSHIYVSMGSIDLLGRRISPPPTWRTGIWREDCPGASAPGGATGGWCLRQTWTWSSWPTSEGGDRCRNKALKDFSAGLRHPSRPGVELLGTLLLQSSRGAMRMSTSCAVPKCWTTAPSKPAPCSVARTGSGSTALG